MRRGDGCVVEKLRCLEEVHSASARSKAREEPTQLGTEKAESQTAKTTRMRFTELFTDKTNYYRSGWDNVNKVNLLLLMSVIVCNQGQKKCLLFFTAGL